MRIWIFHCIQDLDLTLKLGEVNLKKLSVHNMPASHTIFSWKRSDPGIPMRACIYDNRGKASKWLIDLEISLDKNIDKKEEKTYVIDWFRNSPWLECRQWEEKWLIDLEIHLDKNVANERKKPSDWLIKKFTLIRMSTISGGKKTKWLINWFRNSPWYECRKWGSDWLI